MDPFVLLDVHKELEIDNEVTGGAQDVVSYLTFCKLFKLVLVEMGVYIRKNKGAKSP